MSTSPTQQPATQSTKRPLEEPSSPSRGEDQPEAKRPALDKIVNQESEEGSEAKAAGTESVTEQNGTDHPEAEEEDDSTPPPGLPVDPQAAAAIVASTSETAAKIAKETKGQATKDESAWIHIRAVISSPEAATIIGKKGENVASIREMSGARCTVSDYQKGAVERILTVSGIVDAVAKVCFHPRT